jgi:deferrochelatase/peroxidase EfeB
VEVSKLIAEEGLPLGTTGSYGGFQRDDGRSWIGFHDGVTNIEPSQRLAAVQSDGDPEWARGGSFLAFLRIEIDLRIWRRLSRVEQEVVVGRDKLSGCPLESIERIRGGLVPRPIAAEPPTAASGWRERDAYFNPPETTDPLLEASHIHRVNQTRAAGETPAGQRIFRQGYEYLEGIGPDGPRLGLNFISFQRDLERLRQVLGLKGWLGDVNFGGPLEPGPGEPEAPHLLALRAGGFYAVPPLGDSFPGADLFATL